jgi:hypothetical protein
MPPRGVRPSLGVRGQDTPEAATDVPRRALLSRHCGIVSGGGAKWSVVATRVSCAAAKPLVKTPASKPRTGLATRLGTQLGLKCTEFARSRSREIACISTDGARSVYGITPPRK